MGVPRELVKFSMKFELNNIHTKLHMRMEHKVIFIVTLLQEIECILYLSST